MKYPRTFHLPWSPGSTSDDKKLASSSFFHNIEIVITEKLDGSNACLNSLGVFARSHSSPASHESFNWLKQEFHKIKHLIVEGEEIFGENCYALHSIEYSLPSFFFVFGVRKNGKWLSWQDVEKRAKDLGFETVPVLFKGKVKNEKELRTITEKLCLEKSVFGDEREGVVVRLADSFSDLSKSLGKWVRKDHVQTDEHWKYKKVIPQKKV